MQHLTKLTGRIANSTQYLCNGPETLRHSMVYKTTTKGPAIYNGEGGGGLQNGGGGSSEVLPLKKDGEGGGGKSFGHAERGGGGTEGNEVVFAHGSLKFYPY